MMTNKMRIWQGQVSRRLSMILGSQTPTIFLIGVLSIGLVTEGASKLVDALFEQGDLISGLVTLAIGLTLILVLLIFFDFPQLIRRWLSSLRSKSDVMIETNVSRRRGLVVLVSPGQHRAAEPAIKYHYRGLYENEKLPVLQYCWLLAGPGEGQFSSHANAQSLKNQYEEKGITVNICSLNDADDPQEIFRTVREIYQLGVEKYGLSTKDIIFDFTGGTKCMTAGMVLACAAGDWDLEFMKPTKYTADGRAAPDAESVPHLVNVDFFLFRDIDKQ